VLLEALSIELAVAHHLANVHLPGLAKEPGRAVLVHAHCAFRLDVLLEPLRRGVLLGGGGFNPVEGAAEVLLGAPRQLPPGELRDEDGEVDRSNGVRDCADMRAEVAVVPEVAAGARKFSRRKRLVGILVTAIRADAVQLCDRPQKRVGML